MVGESADTILTTQIRILEMIARGEPTDRVLRELCIGIERLVPDAVAGVTVLDRAARSFELAIFPSLEKFESAIPGLRVANRPGSCAVAIYFGEIVTSDDIANDTRFQDEWRELNLAHGIRAIQSRPVFSPEGTSLGTFVLGYRELRKAAEFDEEIVALGTNLAGLALTRHRSEQQHELLIGELQHRTRNLFSTIGALVYFTLQGNPDAREFRKVFEGRLSALSRAHSLALHHWDTDLRSLIMDIVAPYGGAERVSASGPTIKLAPDAAVAFSLATHELATNAAKYGALSNTAGKLHITWDVKRHDSGERMFRLQWAEHGGPLLAAPKPAKAGFGRTAIEKSLAQAVDGVVVLDFPPQGLVCTIEAPLTDRLGQSASTTPS